MRIPESSTKTRPSLRAVYRIDSQPICRVLLVISIQSDAWCDLGTMDVLTRLQRAIDVQT